ncbi:hypothetical protein ACWIUD_03385 [Helicobacter sp. 23-1044]
MRIALILIMLAFLDSALYAESSAESRKTRTIKTINTKSLKNAESTKKIAPKSADSAKSAKAKQTAKSAKPTDSAKSAKSAKPTKSAQSKQSAIKQTTKIKKLGYRNITIDNIKKPKKDAIDFFVGASFGIEFVNMERILEGGNRAKEGAKSLHGSASFGIKGGILSEEKWMGGRFYAEMSYMKIPKFDVLNVGVDLDLLIKYYEAKEWKIGGFIGAGGGMNMAWVADSALNKNGEKALISVGWVNLGLARFVYYHRTGIHSAELNIKITYVTPTIYSLKDKASGVTTSYKAGASSMAFSYVYQF